MTCADAGLPSEAHGAAFPAANTANALPALAKEVVADSESGQKFSPPLSEDELAFYHGGSENDSAVELQGEDVLANIGRELVAVVRRAVKARRCAATFGPSSGHRSSA